MECSRSIFKPLLCFYFSNAQLNHTPFIDGSAMPTVRPIDEEDLTEVGQDGTEQQTPPCPETSATLNRKSAP